MMDRVRKAIPKAIRESVKARFDGRCGYCGEVPLKMHIDHVVAVNAGGTNDPANLMPACFSCNNYKMNMQLETFRGELAIQAKRARMKSLNFRLAERFGLISVHEKPIVFHFEKPAQARTDSTKVSEGI